MATEQVSSSSHTHSFDPSISSRAFINSLNRGLIVHGRDGRIVDVNDAAFRILGLGRDELMGRGAYAGDWAVVRQDGGPCSMEEYPVYLTLRTGKAFTNVILGLDRQGQERRWITLDTSPIVVNEEVVGVGASFSDATDLHQLLERYRLLAENASDIVFEVAPDRTVRWVSPSITEELGWTIDEVVGSETSAFWHPDDEKRVAQRMEALARTGAASFEIRMRDTEGTYHHFALRAKNIRNESGDIIARVGTLRNIDEEVVARAAHVEAEERYRLLAENSSDVIFISDAASVVQWISPSLQDLAGWLPSEVVGRSIEDFVWPADVPSVQDVAEGVIEGESRAYEGRIVTKSGEPRWVSIRVRPIFDADGAVTGGVTNVRDVQAEVLARNEVAERERRFRSVMESAPIGMAVIDLDRRFVYVNPSMCKLLGRTEEWLLSKRFTDVLFPEDDIIDLRVRADALSGAETTTSREERFVRGDGATIWAQHWVSLLPNSLDRPEEYISSLIDITQARESREKLQYQATHDTLTQLLNRYDLFRHAERELSFTQRTGTRVAVLYIDIDHLKEINDSFGHTTGDQTLIGVAQRLTAAGRADDIVSRIGGDEFVILLSGLHRVAEAEEIAENVIRSLATPIQADGQLVNVTVSIGVALAEPGGTADETLRRADAALYRAKGNGRACAVTYDPAVD